MTKPTLTQRYTSDASEKQNGKIRSTGRRHSVAIEVLRHLCANASLAAFLARAAPSPNVPACSPKVLCPCGDTELRAFVCPLNLDPVALQFTPRLRELSVSATLDTSPRRIRSYFAIRGPLCRHALGASFRGNDAKEISRPK